jgi:DNA-binding response OmpR family regulator
VLTGTQLCQHVWEYHFDPESNLVDVYIQRLRRKVDEGEPVKLIQTVRGTGYRQLGSHLNNQHLGRTNVDC